MWAAGGMVQGKVVPHGDATGAPAETATGLIAATADQVRELLAGNEIPLPGYVYDLAPDGRVDVLDLLAADAYPLTRWVISPCLSAEVRSLPPAPDPGASGRACPAWGGAVEAFPAAEPSPNVDEPLRDPLLDQGFNSGAESTPFQLNVEGLTTGVDSGVDPVGDVGPGHYIQSINTWRGAGNEPAVDVGIFDKQSGEPVRPRVCLQDLWESVGGCGGYGGANMIDPIVLHDSLADRWVLVQFAHETPSYISLAVSETADPLGRYHLYAIGPLDVLPDYVKAGVWADAYYLTSQIEWGSPVRFWAVEREKALRGDPAQVLMTERDENLSLPADLDGPPPPPGSPGWFVTLMDDRYWSYRGSPGPDRLSVRSMRVDWARWTRTRLSDPLSVPTAPFRYIPPGDSAKLVPQWESPTLLDACSSVPMYRLQYRNFTDHETLVGNFTVSAAAPPEHRHVLRWFELRRDPGGAWGLYQEGTYGPNDWAYRFFGSIAMNADGDMALGYSIAANGVHTTSRYATRCAADPPGTFRREVNIHEAEMSKTDMRSNWADYSCLSVDPVDDRSFWYVNIYQDMNEQQLPVVHSRIVRIAPATPGGARRPGDPSGESARNGQ
ncbi:MAG: hypothetical protein KA419_19840 [Acidobacteria bacterium]|nr:hypothetical protein [Acidobacteriota bacterium]